MSSSEPFALYEPLPVGRLAIEASAGTGKTYALSTLAARYVAEAGVSIGELLIVTFTRAAAAELKDRVRSRLVEFAELLVRDEPTDSQQRDPVLSRLWVDDPQQRSGRLERVRVAITEFDSATITTIHGFAQQVLGTLGAAVAVDPDAALVDDGASMVTQVATDLLVAEALTQRHPAEDVPGLAELCRVAASALGNPGARLAPDVDDELAEGKARVMRLLVDALRTEIDRRRRDAGTMSFDDILVKLRDAVVDPVGGNVARSALARRFRVALIDEFQDTDPVQWEIFDAVFGHRSDRDGGDATTLVLVGDPKQAIYAFRGANVHTYLQAAHAEGTARRELETNWRSDPAVLASLEHLLTGTTFGDAEITFQPVRHADVHSDRVLRTGSGEVHPALSIRLMDGEGIPRIARGDTRCAHGDAGDHVFRDLATYVRDLLETLEIPGDRDQEPRALQPDDVAVLVSARYEAPMIRRELTRVGIPAVIARGDNVLMSEAADHWHRLLAALARPTEPRRARAFALSWFGGRDANWVADAGDTELAELQEQLHSWAELLAERGVAAFIGHLRAETGVAERVLSLDQGDRSMTDLDHIGELIVLAAGRRPTAASLLALYVELSGGSDEGEPETDLAARRVESEARAVQIMTTFVAKGLEFPVVCVPSMWRAKGATADLNVWWDHDEGVRVIDVATGVPWGPPGSIADREEAASREAVGTNLRVLYVALTRARHHTAVWWLPMSDARRTGLARVLFARNIAGTIDPGRFEADMVDVPFGADAMKALRPLVDAGDGTLEVELVDATSGPVRAWRAPKVGSTRPLDIAVLDRDLPRERRRWSFTAIARHADGHPEMFDPTDVSLGDAGAGDEGQRVDEGVLGASGPLLLGDVPGGAGFGTLVHGVFERIDFNAKDLPGELGAAIDEGLRWSPWDVDRDELIDGLAAVIRTPLGPLFEGRSLGDLCRADRLDELEFDLTLGLAGAVPTDADVGALLVDRLEPGDPMSEWAHEVASGVFGVDLAGHLTGSIDLVARVRSDTRPDRFVVCDYKTNRLAPRGEVATGAHYRLDGLVHAMAEAHYPLQALLYGVAVHRYLRWRVADYDPARHLGGIGYLFVRAMVGPDTPTHAGVPEGLFEWHPPVEVITDLSDLLDGRSVRVRGRS